MNKKILAIIFMASFVSSLHADQNSILESLKSEEVKQQAVGVYPEMNREVSIPLASIQSAWNNAPKGAGVLTVDFNPRETIKIRVREYMTTSIVFPEWEKIKKPIVGDESNYQVLQPEDNIVVIRPISYVGLDTSMTLIGESGYIYTFYVRTEGNNTHNISDITVIIRVAGPLFAKCSSENTVAMVDERTDYLEEAVFDSSKLNLSSLCLEMSLLRQIWSIAMVYGLGLIMGIISMKGKSQPFTALWMDISKRST